MSTARKSKGRQKIEMKKMTNENNLQVTFSKRRSGLFKKASELCTLCGADVALVVFSPGDKVYSFGHPNVDAITDRFLMRAPPQNSGTMQFIEAHRNATVRELNAQLTQFNNQLEAEKRRGDELNRIRKDSMAQFWWASPVEDLNKAQLDNLSVALEELQKSVKRNVDRLVIQDAVANNHAHFFGASSSNSMLPPPAPAPAPLPQMLHSMMLHQNPAMQDHMFDAGFNLNNMGGYGPAAAHGFF